MSNGPLSGIRIVELAGIGPGPFCGMLLSDMGANVLRIERKDSLDPGPTAITQRGRANLKLDLKDEAARDMCLALIDDADALIEGFRPGVMERLGLGPEIALKRNSRLVYGRMTGWGQHGPLAGAAGHDINYIALSGALHAIGPAERPVPPLNLIGDFGGGAMFLVAGILAALLHARATGEGQIVDAAMCDGTASLMAPFYGSFANGDWEDQREANRLDGAAPFYGTYQCADGNWIAIGSIEPQFYALLLERAGIDLPPGLDQFDRATWPAVRERFAEIFRQRSRAEWTLLLEGTDACFAPILSLAEASSHPHYRERESFVTADGVTQPAPAPRFSLTPSEIQPSVHGAESALSRWGWGEAQTQGALRGLDEPSP